MFTPLQPSSSLEGCGPTAVTKDLSKPLSPLPISTTLTTVQTLDHVTPQRSGTIDTLVASSPPFDSDLKSFAEASAAKTTPHERFNWRIASGYFAYFMCGYADGVMATVLPHLMNDFNITFMTGSLFYAACSIGYIAGTLLLEKMNKQLGRISRTGTHTSWVPFYACLSKRVGIDASVRFSFLQSRHLAIMVGNLLHGMFFIIMGTRGGFPAIFVAQVIVAVARAILNGTLNEYFAIVPKHLSYSFSLWGFGSVIAPLICQALLARGVPWYQFYLGSLVGSAINFTLGAIVFRATPSEFACEKQEAELEFQKSLALTPTSTIHNEEVTVSKTKAPNTLRLAFSLRLVWVACLFGAVYFSSETVSQAFMVSFLLEARHGDPNTVGYVTCGFFAGLTLGRLVWGYLTPKLDARKRRLFIAACILTGLGMHLLIWFSRSVPANGAALSVVGLFYGPIWPATLNWANDMLPQEVRMVTMAIISCAATLGNGILPFVAGIILNKKGAYTLPYINTTLTGVLGLYWICLPIKKRLPAQAAGKV